ncbi:LacI family DNA-binding transcriptional regulator [Pseudonocardia zijingensis]|uniref:Substrate-binding domain-containing protein n=1 Tax=Pseudonocardia zijingensis TaxID=153376 RepID=A0ABP3ZV92_9PSEU
MPTTSGGSPRRVTLRDIAREAGVSVTSASRALHGVTGSARAPSAETAARVREAAARLGYSRDQLAGGLRTRRSRLLGMLVPRLSDYVLATIYEGVEEEAGRAGYRTVVANTHDDPDEQRARAEVMLDHRVEGLIIGDASPRGGLLADLERRGVPFVLVSRRGGAFPAATGDDLAGGRAVAGHLLDRGHERVAVLAGEAYASTGSERTAGFLERWTAAGRTVPPDRVVHGPFDAAGGRRAMERVLETPGPPPTAVFVVNDFAAIGAMGALRDAGLQVGRDVALVGYNDVPLSAELPIPLSSVTTPNLEMGRTAVRLLLDILEGGRPGSVLLPPRLRVRASSDLGP